MAPEKKRKRSQDADAASAQQAGTKKKKRSTASTGKPTKPSAAPSKATTKPEPAQSSTVRVSKNEEPAFPRGGASILSPLEYRQIANDAAKDVAKDLFESEDTKRKDRDLGGVKVAKRRTGGVKKGKETFPDEEGKVEDAGPKVEGLSYKRLFPGTLVLGCISQINQTDMALSLPNNLTGYVPLTSISESVTKRAEDLINEEEMQEQEQEQELEDVEGQAPKGDSDDGIDVIDLKPMFQIGQYLRAYVVHAIEPATSRSPGTSGKAKKRIELSLYPSRANGGISTSDLAVGCTVQAAVSSVEDHGLVMDLGVGSGVKGFMSSKEIPKGLSMGDMKQGQVMLCTVTGFSSNGKIVKLSADLEQKPSKKGKSEGRKSAWWVSSAPTIDSFLPGTGVEVLVTGVGRSGGVSGMIMGLLDATIDFFHASGWDGTGLDSKFKAGEKIKARVISTFPEAEPRKVGLSILPHILSFSPPNEVDPTTAYPLSTILEAAKVVKVEPKVGLFLEVGASNILGFVHISRITSERKVNFLSKDSGPYQAGSTHAARIIGYNSMDGLYLLSMEQKILEQPFLRVEDIKIGEIVKGTFGRELDSGDLIVNLAQGIHGIVREYDLSDIKLKDLGRKFREGVEVKGRVLSTIPEKKRVQLTLKKSMVNSDTAIISDYGDASPGTECMGTLIRILPSGALVKFYSNVCGFLPVSEMSEAHIQDPSEHFTVGQSVRVFILSSDPANRRLRVSCRDPKLFGEEQQEALKNISPGDIVSGSVIERSDDDVIVEIRDLGVEGIKGALAVGQLTDGSREKNANAFKKLRAGRTLNDLLVLEKDEEKRSITLSSKPSLVKAAKDGSLIRKFEDVNEGGEVKGWVKNITPTGVFVGFAARITGLIWTRHLPEEIQSLPDFGYVKHQSITAKVAFLDYKHKQFRLSLKPGPLGDGDVPSGTEPPLRATINPVDEKFKSIDDYAPGKVTKAMIVSVQETQLNVKLADNVQGRVDVSLMFDSWEEITNKQHPLHSYKKGAVLDVKIIGLHDARNHRFLAITHRKSNTKSPIFELSAKPSHLKGEGLDDCIKTLEDIAPGSTWLAFINNISSDAIWVNVLPDIRGRVRILDLSDNVSLLKTPEKNFPIGCALKCRVVRVDTDHNKLDLSARGASVHSLTLDKLSKGMVVPGRVTKVNDRHVIIQLSESVFGAINLTDLADDFSLANPTSYSKNDVVRVCVIDIDAPNKRVNLSARPSRVISSDLPVKDPEVQGIGNIKVGDVRRGFVKQVSPKGLFISLGGNATGWVKISDLADTFLKDWKSSFTVDQLVEGKVMAVDPPLGHIQMSLRPSDITGKKKDEGLDLSGLKKGQIVKGRIKNVVEYGVFIAVEGSGGISGLCHKSEIADEEIEEISQLYEVGDPVKAKILKVDSKKGRVSFGLKASYFRDMESGDEGESEGEGENENKSLDGSEDGGEGGGVDLRVDIEDDANEDSDAGKDATVDIEDAPASEGLNAGGFDWSARILDKRGHNTESESEGDSTEEKHKKKRRKSRIRQDLTGDLASREPQSVVDFERLLLGDPNDSKLWIQYMSFQLQLSETEKAREIAERALKTIGIREEKEKLNIWIAMLNMESMYGTNESLEAVFKRACQYNDTQDVHERLASIYIQTGKPEKADELFNVMVKKFSQDPKIWVNYGDFLLSSMQNREAARELLKRAMQALPQIHHKEVISKFAKLEFKNGDPERGRTLFENLLSTFRKKNDLWNMFLDMEIKYGGDGDEEKEVIRGLFARVLAENPSTRQAKAIFKKWLEFEKKLGDGGNVEVVTRRAKEFVEAVKT